MIIVQNVIIPGDILKARFSCDIERCGGKCCSAGVAGAPLENDEVVLLADEIPAIMNFLPAETAGYIERNGYCVRHRFGTHTTGTLAGGNCVFAARGNGLLRCAIEMAWKSGTTNFRKPVSCHLYPIRVRRTGAFDVLYYDRWNICTQQVNNDKPLLYEFAHEALARRYGSGFVDELKEQLASGTGR